MSHYDNSRAFDNYDAWLTTDPSLDAEEPPVNDCVIDLVVGLLGDDGTPWNFYRSVYKSTACGPTIGFLLSNPEAEPMQGPDDPPSNWTPLVWIYNSDLPDTPIAELDVVAGVSVSSIVEGSDVEVEGQKFTGEFEDNDFWKAVEAVNEEADFYWKRDNSRTWIINGPDGEECFVTRTAFSGEYDWPEEAPPNAVVKLKIERFLSEKATVEYDKRAEIPGLPGWTAAEYLDDTTF